MQVLDVKEKPDAMLMLTRMLTEVPGDRYDLLIQLRASEQTGGYIYTYPDNQTVNDDNYVGLVTG